MLEGLVLALPVCFDFEKLHMYWEISYHGDSIDIIKRQSFFSNVVVFSCVHCKSIKNFTKYTTTLYL
jgi:hypothetical protein